MNCAVCCMNNPDHCGRAPLRLVETQSASNPERTCKPAEPAPAAASEIGIAPMANNSWLVRHPWSVAPGQPGSADLNPLYLGKRQLFPAAPAVGKAFGTSPQVQVVAGVSGCKLTGFGAARSGDSLTYLTGPRWTTNGFSRRRPYVQVLAGGRTITHDEYGSEQKPRESQSTGFGSISSRGCGCKAHGGDRDPGRGRRISPLLEFTSGWHQLFPDASTYNRPDRPFWHLVTKAFPDRPPESALGAFDEDIVGDHHHCRKPFPRWARRRQPWPRTRRLAVAPSGRSGAPAQTSGCACRCRPRPRRCCRAYRFRLSSGRPAGLPAGHCWRSVPASCRSVAQ
jgi:hypothetical protein